jgi:hypothetical protein
MEQNLEASVLTAEKPATCEATNLATNQSSWDTQPETLSRYRVCRHRDHKRMCDENGTLLYLIEGMVRPSSVNIAVGDSGLGKSPFFYQMGLCLSAGVPILGVRTERCRVLYVDLENPPDVSLQLKDSITRHLGLPEVPDDFLVCGFDGEVPYLNDENFYRDIRPTFVVIDSLRAWKATAEKSNEEAGRLLNGLRELARQYECAFLLVHHTKKPGEIPVSLETTSIIQWLNQACGARALKNQTDMRMAFEPGQDGSEASLLWKFHLKLKGERRRARVTDQSSLGTFPYVNLIVLPAPEATEALLAVKFRPSSRAAIRADGSSVRSAVAGGAG